MVSCLMGDSTALASAIVRCCPKYIRQENQPELIKQAALHGVFDEMRCARRYINVKRYVNQHPKLRMVDKRVRHKGERFRCDVIVRQPESKEEATN